MAQVLISGTTGNVSFPSGGCKMASWSATVSQTVTDTTGYADDVWGTAVGENNLVLSGSASGFLTKGTSTDQPNAAALLTATGGSVTLTADTGCTYTFVAIFSDVSISHARIGPQTISFNFRSTGVVTEAWSIS